jgi:hypothetical protein
MREYTDKIENVMNLKVKIWLPDYEYSSVIMKQFNMDVGESTWNIQIGW